MRYPLYKVLLLIADLISVLISFYISAFIYELVTKSHYNISFLNIEQGVFIFLFSIIVLVILKSLNLYKLNVLFDFSEHLLNLSICAIISTILLASLAFFLKFLSISESRLVIALFFPVSLVIFFLYRVIIFIPLYRFLAKRELFTEKVVIVGGGDVAKMLAANLEFNKSYGLSIVGFIDDNVSTDTVIFHGKRVLGRVDSINEIVKSLNVQEIIICTEDTTIEKFLDILDICINTNARVKVASPFYGIVKKINSETYGSIEVVEINKQHSISQYALIKRIFDIVLSLIGIIILLPVMSFIAIAIYIDSGRPVIFSQIRIGKNGKPFKFYKFRSMYQAREEKDRIQKVREFIKMGKKPSSTTTKIVDVNRITRVGKFIRKTSLDELPQLFNVIKGDMSLVGPRPCLPYEWEEYKPWHRRRLSTTPGCTGVWQVSGRSEVSFDDMVIMDLYYIQSQSLFFDLKIILKTFPVMLFGKGGL